MRVRFEGRLVRGRHPLVYMWDNFVFVVDANDGGRSMTNDAEAVVAEIAGEFGPQCRLIYRDTERRWDEMRIGPDGQFAGFAPYEGWVPEL